MWECKQSWLLRNFVSTINFTSSQFSAHEKRQYSLGKPRDSYWFKRPCLSCLAFICVHCFLKMIKLYKDIWCAWISRTSVEIFFQQIDVIKSQKYNRSIAILRRALLWIFGKRIVPICDHEIMKNGSWNVLLNRYGLIALGCFYSLSWVIDIHTKFSFWTTWSLRTIMSYWENWEIDYLVWTMLSFQRKLRTGLVNDKCFNKVVENVVCCLFTRNSEMDYMRFKNRLEVLGFYHLF